MEYGFQDGILEAPVVAVSTDETQNLWVATHAALYLLRPGESRFHRYDTSNSNLHLQGNPVTYCADQSFLDGDRNCRDGAAGDPGITTIVGGGPNEVFVGYEGVHDWTDPHDGDWFSVNRHSGKLDRVRLKDDGTLDVVRFDLVSGNSTGRPEFWHNRIVFRMVYDHFVHKHELYLGAEHGVDKLSPDKWFEPRKDWPFVDNLYWMSDHLHPTSCFHQWCTGNEGHDNQRMGDWRGLALTADGDLWVGGRWAAGKIFYTPLNAGLKPDGTPDAAASDGWFQRGGRAYKSATGRNYTFGFQFCGTSGVVDMWTEPSGPWVTTPCTPGDGSPPVFLPPNPGDPVSISAVAVAPDGKVWFASGPFGSDAAYGIASYDDHSFRHFDPMRDAGMLEENVADMVALPDGRLVLAGPTTGLVFWNPPRDPLDPGPGEHVSLRAGHGIPDDHVIQLELDTMVDPPALHVATRGGAAVLRVFP